MKAKNFAVGDKVQIIRTTKPTSDWNILHRLFFGEKAILYGIIQDVNLTNNQVCVVITSIRGHDKTFDVGQIIFVDAEQLEKTDHS